MYVIKLRFWESSVVSFSAIILAAGQGTRMSSFKPKVMQVLAAKPLLHHVLTTVAQLNPVQTLVVCGYKGELLQQNCTEFNIDWVWQTEQRGTGHAVQCAYPELHSDKRVLVLYGDVPLIKTQTLNKLLANTPDDAIGILTVELDNPYGLGRIVSDQSDKIIGIIEERDATPEQRKIRKINSGIYVLPYKYLAGWLANLQPHNQQQEYYLTDVITMAVNASVQIVEYKTADPLEVAGINSQAQLAAVERDFQLVLARALMEQGVKLYDPARLDIRGTVQAGQDVSIDVNVILEGKVVLGDNVTIGPNVQIKNSIIDNGAIIHAHSHIDSATIGAECQIGPFARIRPGTELKARAKIGNFVETKNASIGLDSKINHLSYIGDAEIGNRVNIGAGVITCNYDGAFKHRTIIEDDAFIGSNCELVAPVTIGKGATLAAGTTLIKDAPAGALTLTKKILANIFSWQRPMKQPATQCGEQ